MAYTVYILYSETLNKYYIGYTSVTLESRLQKHNANHKGFTGRNTDWVVKYFEHYNTKSEAMKREKEIKAWKSRIRVQQLISSAE
jgi:putative endonuclease